MEYKHPLPLTSLPIPISNPERVERELRELDGIHRWQIVRVLRQQSVASHSWLVAAYSLRIAQQLNWLGNYEALMHEAIFHDLDELVTGDIPRTVKWAINKIGGAKEKIAEIRDGYMRQKFAWWNKTEDEEARAIVYFADILESRLYVAEETRFGNSNMENVDLLTDLNDQVQNAAATLDRILEKNPPSGWRLGWCEDFAAYSLSHENGDSHIITQPQ